MSSADRAEFGLHWLGAGWVPGGAISRPERRSHRFERLSERIASAQRLDRGRGHVLRLPAPLDAEIVGQGRGLGIAELVGKARHGLHAFEMREILGGDAVEDGDDQVRGSLRRKVLFPRSATTVFGTPAPSSPWQPAQSAR